MPLSAAARAAAAALTDSETAGEQRAPSAPFARALGELGTPGSTLRAGAGAGASAGAEGQGRAPSSPDDEDEVENELRDAYVAGLRACADPSEAVADFERVSHAQRPFRLLADARFRAYCEGRQAGPRRTTAAELAAQVNLAAGFGAAPAADEPDSVRCSVTATAPRTGAGVTAGKGAASEQGVAVRVAPAPLPLTTRAAVDLIAELDSSDLLVRDGCLSVVDRARWLQVAARQKGALGRGEGPTAPRVQAQVAAKATEVADGEVREARAAGRAMSAAALLAYASEAEAALAERHLRQVERRRARGLVAEGAAVDVRVSPARGLRMHVDVLPKPTLAMALFSAATGCGDASGASLRPCALRMALAVRGVLLGARQAAFFATLFPANAEAAADVAAVQAGAADASAIHEALAGAPLVEAAAADNEAFDAAKMAAIASGSVCEADFYAARAGRGGLLGVGEARQLRAAATSFCKQRLALSRALHALDRADSGVLSVAELRYGLRMAGCGKLDGSVATSVASYFPVAAPRFATADAKSMVAYRALLASIGPALAMAHAEGVARGLQERRPHVDEPGIAMSALCACLYADAVAACKACEALGESAAPEDIAAALGGEPGVGEWAARRCEGKAPGSVDGPLAGLAFLAAVECT